MIVELAAIAGILAVALRRRLVVAIPCVLLVAGWGAVLAARGKARAAWQRPLPSARGDGYVGSTRCGTCHPSELASWKKTYHRTMTQVATPSTVKAPWTGTVLGHALASSGDTLTADGARVTLVTGSHAMQVFWIDGGDGRDRALPFTWLIAERRFVPRDETFIVPPLVGAFSDETWNTNCLQCHATGGAPRASGASYATETGELGIACEACHGPGARHAAENEDPLRRYYLHLKTGWRDDSIVNPAKQPPDRANAVCGQCHGLRLIADEAGFLKDGVPFRPGQALETTIPLIRPRTPGAQGFLAANPGFRERHYWPDGTVRVSGRDLSGLVESACYQKGGATCTSCHSMHAAAPDKQLRTTGCASCHTMDAGHSHHDAGAAVDCVDCHMPRTVYGLLRGIRQHQIDRPRVVSGLAERPNACNLCHLDRSLGWTADALARWWNVPAPALTDEERSLAWGVRAGAEGNAVVRALAAVAMAARPAAWMRPIVDRLLADPIAAVRHVAARIVVPPGDAPPLPDGLTRDDTPMVMDE